MRIAAFISHTRARGGVARFLEIGNELVDRGFRYTLYSLEASKTGWFGLVKFPVKLWTTPELASDDVIFCGDPAVMMRVRETWPNVRKVMFVLGVNSYHAPYVPEMRSGGWDTIVFVKEDTLRFHEQTHKAKSVFIPGGVNTRIFSPNVRVGYHYRSSKNCLAVKEALSIPTITPVPIAGLPQVNLAEVLRSLKWFVSWEEPGGWANMAIQALACGASVITNGVNCEAFLKSVYVLPDLDHVRMFFEEFGKEVERFSWQRYVDRLVEEVLE